MLYLFLYYQIVIDPNEQLNQLAAKLGKFFHLTNNKSIYLYLKAYWLDKYNTYSTWMAIPALTRKD